jgi:hypothetical protein
MATALGWLARAVCWLGGGAMCYPDPCHPGFMVHVMRGERCACGALPELPRGSSS